MLCSFYLNDDIIKCKKNSLTRVHKETVGTSMEGKVEKDLIKYLCC